MDNNYTHILFILDNSASMSGLREDAINGFNEFVKEQQKLDGKCRLDTLRFSTPDSLEYINEHEDINDVEEISGDVYTADGWSTALLDAIGKGIDDLGEKLREMPKSDRPSKVMINIFTDGLENSSQKFNATRIKQMIDHQEEVYDWEFVFLAADLDAAEYGRNVLGLGNVANTEKSSKGILDTFTTMNEVSSAYRTRGVAVNAQSTYDDVKNRSEEDED